MKARSRLRKAKSRLPKGYDVRPLEIRNKAKERHALILGVILGTIFTYSVTTYLHNSYLRPLIGNKPENNQCKERMCVGRNEVSSSGTDTREKIVLTDIESYIIEVFGETDGFRAIEMIKGCENKTMNPMALNTKNSNGSTDAGLFQINSVHGYTHEQLFDPYFNTDVAYKIYQRAGNSFRPWACANVVDEISFWQI